MEQSHFIRYDAAQDPLRFVATDSRAGPNLVEATMRSAHEAGMVALRQAAEGLASEQDRQAILSPKTMDDVIASIIKASERQPGQARRASQWGGDHARGFTGRIRELQKLTSVWEQHHPECSSLIWTLLGALIAQGSNSADLMRSLYSNLTQISECLSPFSFDTGFQTSISGQLAADLYASIIDFLVSFMEWMRGRGRRLTLAMSSGRYYEGQRNNLVKIDNICEAIRRQQSQAIHLELIENRPNIQQIDQLLRQQLTTRMEELQKELQQRILVDLQTSPFSMMANVRVGRGLNEVDGIDSTLAMMLSYATQVRGTQGSAWINQKDQDRQNILHAASRQGYLKVVQWALENGVDAKALDSDGRTPLFGAVEGCHDSVARLLITSGAARGMDVNQVSKKGQSALDIAVAIADAKGLAMVRLLLEHKASPIAGVNEFTPHLLSCAARGSLPSPPRGEHVSRLADKDRLGYTALHEAVSFGHWNVVNSLIHFKIDINTRAAVGGDSILHVLIERGRHYRGFYQESSGRSLENLPSLGPSQVQIARLLLEYGVVATRTRWSDGLTPQELIMEKLKEFGPGLGDGERSTLEAILGLLRDPPPVRSQLKAPQEVTSIPTTDDIKKAACNHFDILVVRNLVQQTFPLGSFIYDNLAEDASKNKSPLDHANPKGDASVKRDWKWVHLPANNKTWVKVRCLTKFPPSLFTRYGVAAGKGMQLTSDQDLIRTFKARENSMIDLKWPDSLSWSRVNGFIETSFHEFRGLATHARFRRPMFTSLSGSPHLAISSLVIPYFDVETLESHCAAEDFGDLPSHQIDKADSLPRLKKWKGLRDAYEDLHTPCSLDQSYYLFLRDSTPRDKTQIVVKYARRKADLQNSAVQSTKLLMVNQIWLWRIDPETLVTSFPNRRHENSKSELLDLVLEGMGRDQPEVMDRMILQILVHAIGFVDEPWVNAGLDENLFDMFEQSIAHEADAETNCYRELYEAQEELRNIPDETAWARLDEKMCNIVREVEHLREIKDILDELKMIDRVLTDQQTVVQQYEKSAQISQTEDKAILEDLKDTLKFRISKVERLTKDANAVENSLNDLLDLKQKQANLIEARDTRRLANEAENRALAGEKQGKLIFLFTLVTVIFTPLSFASSLLAVPSQGFPQDSTGGGVGWTLWQVVTAIIVTEVIGVLIPMAFMWFWMLEGQDNKINKPFQKVWNKVKMLLGVRSGSNRRMEEAIRAGAVRRRETIGSMRREDGAANC